MNWIRTLVHRPALVTVIYLIIFIFGLFSYSRLPIDMLPDIQAPVISIVTPYPGASALDVEDKISEPIEDALGSISGLKEISSTSRDNISLVTLLFQSSVDINEAANDIRQNLEPLKNAFPDDSDAPMVTKFDFTQMPILIFSVTAKDKDIRMLRDDLEAELIEPLQRTPGVGSVFVRNAPEKIVRVDVDREKLRAHNLTMSDVAQLIGANNLNIPAGDITMGALNVSLRLPGEATSLDELRQLPLLRSPIGEGVVTLQDIASVDLQLEDSQEVAFVNGETAVMGYLRKTSDANTVEVTKTALQVFQDVQERMPDIKIETLEAGASFIEGTINNKKNNSNNSYYYQRKHQEKSQYERLQICIRVRASLKLKVSSTRSPKRLQQIKINPVPNNPIPNTVTASALPWTHLLHWPSVSEDLQVPASSSLV